jgi:hypothetical protein
MTYIAEEPTPVTMYKDTTGHLHETRDQALEANFRKSCEDAISDLNYDDVVQTVIKFVAKHPDLVRVMLGDRGIT